MNMKYKAAGICIFAAAALILLLAAAVLKTSPETETPVPKPAPQVPVREETEKENILASAPEPDTEQAVTSSAEEEPYLYILFAEDGRLSVYLADGKTVYLDTGISAESLPEERRIQLENGIRFRTEEELFSFLESYSS